MNNYFRPVGDAPAIMVWNFQDAPEELRGLSENGGDEDWVVAIPAGMPVPQWVLNLDSCGMPQFLHISGDKFWNGSTIVICSHA